MRSHLPTGSVDPLPQDDEPAEAFQAGGEYDLLGCEKGFVEPTDRVERPPGTEEEAARGEADRRLADAQHAFDYPAVHGHRPVEFDGTPAADGTPASSNAASVATFPPPAE